MYCPSFQLSMTKSIGAFNQALIGMFHAFRCWHREILFLKKKFTFGVCEKYVGVRIFIDGVEEKREVAIVVTLFMNK